MLNEFATPGKFGKNLNINPVISPILEKLKHNTPWPGQTEVIVTRIEPDSYKAVCCSCGEKKVICCDSGININPICTNCCQCVKNPIWDGKSVANGIYEALKIN